MTTRLLFNGRSIVLVPRSGEDALEDMFEPVFADQVVFWDPFKETEREALLRSVLFIDVPTLTEEQAQAVASTTDKILTAYMGVGHG